MIVLVLVLLSAIHLIVPDVLAKPQSSTSPVPILSQTEVVGGGDGTFNFSFETGDGVRRIETGFLRKASSVNSRSTNGSDALVQVIQGSYSYTSPDGQAINLRYVADENGFQPEGDHLPKLANVSTGRALPVLSSLQQQQSGVPQQHVVGLPQPAVSSGSSAITNQQHLHQ